MGGDDAVVQAARVSYGSGTKGLRDDRALVRYLLSHQHTTPFEMSEIKFHVKLPIFVARQWIRHRMASVNEYSARYSVLDKEYYIPERNVVSSQSNSNKQGRGDIVPADFADEIIEEMNMVSERSYDSYLRMLNQDDDGNDLNHSRIGISRELARSVLPVSYYTQWYWKVDLHNLMRFLELRLDPHAQWEIRQYAQKIAEIVEIWTPHTFEAFNDYRTGRLELSKAAASVVRRWLAGDALTQEESGLSAREWRELHESLGRSF